MSTIVSLHKNLTARELSPTIVFRWELSDCWKEINFRLIFYSVIVGVVCYSCRCRCCSKWFALVRRVATRWSDSRLSCVKYRRTYSDRRFTSVAHRFPLETDHSANLRPSPRTDLQLANCSCCTSCARSSVVRRSWMVNVVSRLPINLLSFSKIICK